MNMKGKSILYVLVAVLLVGCAGGGSKSSETKEKAEFKALPFPDVQLPMVISSQEEALEYMAQNYWNNFTEPTRDYPSDSLMVSGVLRGDVEQKFADWTAVLDQVDPEVSEGSISKLYDRILACEQANAGSDVFEALVELFQRYFYDPNSPLRNEERYLPFVKKYAEYEGLTEVERDKHRREARLCSLNRIASKAADFRFADRNGRIRHLYDIDADLILLFFSNPGCEACMNIINMLNGHPSVSRLISEGRLAVLNIYIDEDIQAWRSYMPIYPENWYNGFDPDMMLRGNEIYCIRAIPSLYLLDGDKGVIMKDAPEDKVMNFLSGIDMESFR